LNNLRKNYVKPKQKLLVYAKPVKNKSSEVLTASATTKSANNRKDSSSARGSRTDVIASSGNSENLPNYYFVKSGESLVVIAMKFHCTVEQLKKWNNLSSDKVIIGQKIKINPSSKQETSGTKPDTNKTSKSIQSGTTKITMYTIQPGDNLWEIADKFDVTVSQLKALNKINNANRLKPGQKIRIP